MRMIPAIDLRHGRVVRLERGDDRRRTSYAGHPREVLERFATEGVELVHVVDLDGAFGEAPQRQLVAELAGSGATRIELGGGLGDRAAVDWALEAGCEAVVLGSLVATDFDAFVAIVEAFPGRVIPALEMAAGKLRIAGWRREAGLGLDELCRRLPGLDCPSVLVTDVERDGTLTGPNFKLAREVAAATGMPAILSGGIRSTGDLWAASRVVGIGATIVGKALYENRFSVAAGLAACLPTAGRPIADKESGR